MREFVDGARARRSGDPRRRPTSRCANRRACPRIPFPKKKVPRQVALEELAILEEHYPQCGDRSRVSQRVRAAHCRDSFGAVHRCAGQHDHAGAFRQISDAGKARSRAPEPDVEKIIKSCGFFRMKAKNIIACARDLVERFGGRVPREREDLSRWRVSAARRRASSWPPHSNAGARGRYARLSRRASPRANARKDAAPSGRGSHRDRACEQMGRRYALVDYARPRDLQSPDAPLLRVARSTSSARPRRSSRK